MKKKPDANSASKSYEGICLYRDNIDFILAIIKDNNYEIKIVDKEFEYDTLDELIEKRGVKPSFFEINGERKKEFNFVTISFEKKKGYLRASGSENAIHLFNKLRDIFESNYSKLYKILNPWIYFWPAILLINLYGQLLADKSKKETTTIPQWLPIITIFSIATLAISVLYRYNISPVVLKRSHEGGFWKRNSDKIALLLIGTIIGVLVKYIIELILKTI